jgi:hypothetical protein
MNDKKCSWQNHVYQCATFTNVKKYSKEWRNLVVLSSLLKLLGVTSNHLKSFEKDIFAYMKNPKIRIHIHYFRVTYPSYRSLFLRKMYLSMLSISVNKTVRLVATNWVGQLRLRTYIIHRKIYFNRSSPRKPIQI